MKRFEKLSPELWTTLQYGAGVLLCDTESNVLGDYNSLMNATYANILGATSGGIAVSVVPQYYTLSVRGRSALHDLGMVHSYQLSISGSLVSSNPSIVRLLLGGGDLSSIADTEDNETSYYRVQLKTGETSLPKNIWWIGDYGVETGDSNGGYIAIHMRNIMSTGGFQLQTEGKKLGQFNFQFQAWYSASDINSGSPPCEMLYFSNYGYSAFMVRLTEATETSREWQAFLVCKTEGDTLFQDLDNDTEYEYFKFAPPSIDEALNTPIFGA